ncbi:Hypothetical predicted protein [Mytilus galloprovincialis]|uniref:Uncharacterized protein n=1 Tax=Mytilus galloprovincialis TaxID=29158 RepID=A0A8B6ESI8_MYTGA|nr:Hypothetical predicted protein [Mytilus galloprovincialis]
MPNHDKEWHYMHSHRLNQGAPPAERETKFRLQEKRRNLKNEIKEVKAVKLQSECYEIDDEQIRNVVDLRVDDVLICNQCVKILKAVLTCETKLKNLLNNIKKSASPQFIEFAKNLQTVVELDEDEYPAIHTITEKCPTTTKKMTLHALTSSKSGCTPRGKRNRISTPSKGLEIAKTIVKVSRDTKLYLNVHE